MKPEMDAQFTRKEQIADRLVQRAAAIWGIEHPDMIDPIIQLLVDVLSYELSRIGLESVESDGRQLERLANVLVPGGWLLPRPAHALMSAYPLEPKSGLRTIDQFYIPIKEKGPSGEETVSELFFSPLRASALLRGKVAFKAVEGTLFQVLDNGNSLPIRPTRSVKPSFRGAWLGLEMDPGIKELEEVTICIRYADADLEQERLLPLLNWQTASGQRIAASPYSYEDGEPKDEEFDGENFIQLKPEQAIWTTVAGAYRNRLQVLRAEDGQPIRVETGPIPVDVAEPHDAPQLAVVPTALWWIRVEFPAAVSMDVIEQAQFNLNCFPVVAKARHYLQQRLQPNLNIIPLRIPEGAAMLSVDSVMDDQGRALRRLLYQGEDTQPGAYRWHQGDLERLDRATADAYLAKTYRLVQEESSLFAAFGQDLMLKQLNNLKKDLEAIRTQLGPVANTAYKDRHYLLVEPQPDAKNIEVDYWSVDMRDLHRLVRGGAILLPYKQVNVLPGSAKLITPIVPGRQERRTEEKLSAFRTGLLTRNRIVSKHDIRSFVLHFLSGFVVDVELSNGVTVSSNPKQGLVRTTDLVLTKAPGVSLSKQEWAAMLTALEHDLKSRSVHTVAYRLFWQPSENLIHEN